MNYEDLQRVHEQLAVQHDALVRRFDTYALSQDAKYATMLHLLEQLVTKVDDANKSSSTSSGVRVPCPMQCGADFKKVHAVRIIALLIITDSRQSSYLLDHLHRSCKISKRQALRNVHSECEFQESVSLHKSLWLSVFPQDAAYNDENVRLCCQLASYH